MFSKFDRSTMSIIERATDYSKKYFKIHKIGTESFLYVMFSDEDSLCHILLEEYRVSIQEIEGLLHSLVIIRNQNGDFTDKLKEVFQTAAIIAGDNGDGIVYEEHLFFALLMVKNTLFINELGKLNLNSQNLLEDVRDYFNLKVGKEVDNYAINLSTLAKNKQLDKLIGRDDYLQRMEIVLNRKNKNNLLLIGSAGVGKSALVEGLAEKLLNTNVEIISLNIASIVANTKYRGDFEARINKILDEVTKDNTILFIDEIHTIMGAGSTDNSLDLANILKPYLARGNFRCIGATTIEEYQKSLVKDKALARRFQPIFVSEPTKEETHQILLGIYQDFTKFHQVKIEPFMLDYIVEMATKITNRKFPDKAIDLLDESLSVAKIQRSHSLNNQAIDLAFANISGLTKGVVNYAYHYQELESLYLDNYIGCNDKKYIASICFKGDENNLRLLLNEMSLGLGISKEMILDIDLSNFTESFSIATLLGSPNGYVGYEEGGIISEHFAKYPAQILVIRNLDYAHSDIQMLFDKLLMNSIIYDRKGREINTERAVFIFINKENQVKQLGFVEMPTVKHQNEKYDFILDNKICESQKDSTLLSLKRRGYLIELDSSEYNNLKIDYKKSFVRLLTKYEIGHYSLKYDLDSKEVQITKV